MARRHRRPRPGPQLDDRFGWIDYLATVVARVIVEIIRGLGWPPGL